ncbi:MAG: patatin-like phospholipase family protein [Acidobacteriota bacterium]|nr:patatin-like phospholipase family protein [Acidobacteriota bacterium]
MRPKIGLALSGGGARGGAHVGVLRVLEELNIPVDYIAGTSMGAVIGGLYAAGLTPDELAVELTETDWEEVFKDTQPRARKSFRRKQEEREDLFSFDLGLGRSGFKIGSGLITGRKLNALLRTKTLHIRDLDTFDQLPVPFQAVATDLATGQPVVLDRGDLVTAIRASMAIPAVFRPVKLDGRILVDGGVVQNLPVETLRAMGADIVIAVDVSTPPGSGLDDPNALMVARQSVDLMSYQNIIVSRGLIRDRDILITPDLKDMAAFDFGKLHDIIAVGRVAAQACLDRLKPLGIDPADYETHRERLETFGKRRHEAIIIDQLEIRGLTRIDPKPLAAKLAGLEGTTLDWENLRRDLVRLSNLGEFQEFGFRVEKEGETDRLVIELGEDERGPGFLRLGLRLRSELRGNGEFTILANYRRTMVNRFGAEWKTRASFGDLNSIDSEFYQPFGFTSPWFASGRITWRHDLDEVFGMESSRVEATTRRTLARAELGRQIGYSTEIRTGVYAGGLNVQEDEADFTPGNTSVDLAGFSFRVVADHMDHVDFPRRGSLVHLEFTSSQESLGADENYEKAELNLVQALSWGRGNLMGRLRFDTEIGSGVPYYDRFNLGGLFNMSGLSHDALQGQTAGFAQLLYYRRLTDLPPVLGLGLYAGLGLEAGNVWDGLDFVDSNDLKTGFNGFLGAETILGPMFLGYGRTEGEDSFHFVLGHVFNPPNGR